MKVMEIIKLKLKGDFSIVMPQLDGGVFFDFSGETSTHVEKTELSALKLYYLNKRSFGER